MRCGGLFPVFIGNPSDMSLKKNTPNQNVTFGLTSATDNSALTGLGSGVTIFVSKDGGPQTSAAGTVTELGNGAYNYAPTQAETNGDCVSFMLNPTGGVPTNLMFLTYGLHKNRPSQHITFSMMNTAGVPDTAATVSVFVTKDSGAQSAGGGTVTNLGHGQYDYAPTQSETNGNEVAFLFSATGDVIQNISIFTVP